MNKYVKIITGCVLAAAAAGLGIFASRVNSGEDAVPTFSPELEPQSKITTEADPLPENWADLYEYSPSASGMTERARQLLRENPDMVGWIKIDKTQVDYPILLDPGAIPENTPYYGPEGYGGNSYYIHRDLDRSYKKAGSLFMDFRDNFGSSEAEQSENIVIYGHNMLDGSMFGDLRKYRTDYSFYEKAPFIELSSNYKDYDYVIFSFIRIDGGENAEFRYWDMEELDDKETFDYYVNVFNDEALIETGVDVRYGDKILTLQTCADRYDDERFLIAARRLREGEVAGDMSTIQRTEKYIKEHQPEPTTEATEAQQ